MPLSPQSLWLLERWHTYQQLRKVEANLREEVVRTLDNLVFEVERYARRHGRSKKWELQWLEDTAICMTRPDWNVRYNPFIQVGIRDFSVEALFFDAPPPVLYVWVTPKREALLAGVHRYIFGHRPDAEGVLQMPDNGDLVRVPFPKLTVAEAHHLEQLVLPRIVEFMAGWMELLEVWDQA